MGRVQFCHPLLHARDWQDRPQLDDVCRWWSDGGSGVCSLIGIGGAGKTAIADRFLQVLPGAMPPRADLPKRSDLRPLEQLFVFSFYDAPNPDSFFASLFNFLVRLAAGEECRCDAVVKGPAADRPPSYEQTLLALESAGPCLLVLDGHAHKDNDSTEHSKRWLDRLREHLEPLVQQENITLCSDQDIDHGEDWHNRIQAQLNGARAAVLLVSPAFLASKYIRNSELPVLLKHAKDKGVRIIPVILKPCLFADTKFKYPDPKLGPEEFLLSSLQAVGSLDKALSEMTEGEQDRALLSVAQTLARLANP